MRVVRLVVLATVFMVITFGVNVQEALALGQQLAGLPVALIGGDEIARGVLRAPGAVSLLASAGVGLWSVLQRRLRRDV